MVRVRFCTDSVRSGCEQVFVGARRPEAREQARELRWVDSLGLQVGCLRASTVNRPSSASKGKRPQLLHGTARIAVYSTFIVQSIYGAIQEYAGIDRPEWLDLGVRLPAPCPTTASSPSPSASST
jgi:hypothetical protein